MAYGSVGIMGAGAWGSALAVVASNAAQSVKLWTRDADLAASLNARGSARNQFPGAPLLRRISATTAQGELAACEVLLVAVPAQTMRATLIELKKALGTSPPLVVCAKGIERGSGLLSTEVLREIMPDAPAAILSGPSFAHDVTRGHPTAVTIAGEENLVHRLQATLGSHSFRPYRSDDVTGVALGGAAKNVYAIAAGIADGLGLGESARAALLARSFAELMRVGEALGAKRETLMGLSGLGDLILTATSPTSRNFALGVALGEGASLATSGGRGQPLAEGVDTAPALVERARRLATELPIAEATAAVLAGAIAPREAIGRLMSRPLTSE